MFKKILVPYDGSEPADRAVDQAVNIAKTIGRDKPDAIILHVIGVSRPPFHRTACTVDKVWGKNHLITVFERGVRADGRNRE